MGSTKHRQLMEAGGVSKLHLAVFQGKEDKARKLLERGCPDINRGDKFGQTPLHIACHREGLLGCLRLLASYDANFHALDANGNTALHSSAGSGATASAEFLLGRGLSVLDKNNDGHTPMDICNVHCPTHKQKEMRAVLQGGAKIEEDRAAGGVGTPQRNRNFQTSSETAPSHGELVGGMSSSSGSSSNNNGGGNVFETGPHSGLNRMEAGAGHDAGAGAAASSSAAAPSTASEPKKSSRSPFLSVLYRGGSSFSSTRSSPRTTRASEGEVGGSGENKVNNSVLFTPRRGPAKMAAVSRQHGAAGASPATEYSGQTASSQSSKKATLQELHLAIFQGDTAKVQEVVDRGDMGALNEADRHGQTPLHLACYKGSRVMARILVEGGADLNAVDVNGNGVVHAAVCDSPAVLAILLDNGADALAANHDGLTPKGLCEQYCPPRFKERMLSLLREAALAQARASVRKEQILEEQANIDTVYEQLGTLRSKLMSAASPKIDGPTSEASESALTENTLLTLVEANVRVLESQRHALEEMENTATRLERMFRRLHMRFDASNPGDVMF